MVRWFSTLVAWLLTAPAAFACELALVLAVDVSGSVDPDEYDVQMRGLAAALLDGSVSEALVRSKAQVMLLQWTGSGRQSVSIPWTQITTFDEADALAAQVALVPRSWRNFSTAIGEALEVSILAFEAPEVASCKRRVIDVSGDGPSNEGIVPEAVHVMAAEHDITINALAIEANEAGLTAYFRNHVITGKGSFAMRAADFRDYPARILAKLLREVTNQFADLR